jgi:protein-S-isoprenylcysteine O-methyltransferase Ste14
MSAYTAILCLWGAWILSWMVAASWSNRTEARPRFGAELLYRIVSVAGFLLLFGARREPPLWKASVEFNCCLVGVAAGGFILCWWARIHLGRMWSSSVTYKADHRIVDTGPYALVRHPIYTGIIIAAAATAALQARAIAFAGLVLLILGFWIKARLEERFLRDHLGAQAYDAYARRTGLLFPGL